MFKNAIYIKLGEKGSWEDDSIKNNKIRFGWKLIDTSLIKNNDWPAIRELIKEDFLSRGKKNGATNDFNALKNICEATEETIFVTFSNGKLYWCKPKHNSIQEDNISKFLETNTKWTCCDILNRRVFEINQISGKITKYQMFMGTTCSIGNKLNELSYLRDLINGNESEGYKNLLHAKGEMKNALIPAIKNLTPKDFEILTDLVFRNFGWKRTSVLGEVMKFFDLVLEEPFSKKLHGVQIKSEASLSTYHDYANKFNDGYENEFASLFFVVHTPDKKLETYIGNNNDSANDKIKILSVDAMADYCIDAGLITWIMDKSR